jgi:hypothetical protein
MEKKIVRYDEKGREIKFTPEELNRLDDSDERNKKSKMLILYPSYSMRDYEKNKYMLDSDAEFQQAIQEIRILKEWFEEIFLIIPEEDQRILDKKRIPSYVKLIEKRYEYNVGSERFANDVEFFSILSVRMKDKDWYLYTCFTYKWRIYKAAGIDPEKILNTFWHFYPTFDGEDFDSEYLRKSIGIIFRSDKQTNHFLENVPSFPEKKAFMIRSHHGLPFVSSTKIPSGEIKTRCVVLPTRFDHEDFNHTWESLMVLLGLKADGLNFRIILCNPNNSGKLSPMMRIADEIGPLSKKRFEEILATEIGVIFVKKETDYGGTKGAPEYMASNLIFISNDYNLNPLDVMNNDNTMAYNWIKKMLTIPKEEYVRIKQRQKDIADTHNGKKYTTEEFKKILGDIIG